MESLGAKVLIVCADIAVRRQMREALDQARRAFGRLDGVIHAAGVADGALIQRRTREQSEAVFASKIRGTLVLEELLREEPPPFLLLCSALTSVLGSIGQSAYVAANAFLDAVAQGNRSQRTSSASIGMHGARWVWPPLPQSL